MRFGVLFHDGSMNIHSNMLGEGHAWKEAITEAAEWNKTERPEHHAQPVRIVGEIAVESITEERRPDPEPGAKHPGGGL